MVSKPMNRWYLSGFSTVIAISTTAAVLFFGQGGFGGGHGRFDQILFALSLPWSLIPWPEAVYLLGDSMWLVLLPFLFNLAVVFTVIGVRRMHLRRKYGGA